MCFKLGARTVLPTSPGVAAATAPSLWAGDVRDAGAHDGEQAPSILTALTKPKDSAREVCAPFLSSESKADDGNGLLPSVRVPWG